MLIEVFFFALIPLSSYSLSLLIISHSASLKGFFLESLKLLLSIFILKSILLFSKINLLFFQYSPDTNILLCRCNVKALRSVSNSITIKRQKHWFWVIKAMVLCGELYLYLGIKAMSLCVIVSQFEDKSDGVTYKEQTRKKLLQCVLLTQTIKRRLVSILLKSQGISIAFYFVALCKQKGIKKRMLLRKKHPQFQR